MKTILLFAIAAAFVLSSCSQSQGNQNQSSSSKKNIEKKVSDEFDNTSKNVSGTVIVLNKKDFMKSVSNFQLNKEWKYEGDKPCIVDFYANWCRPCRMIAPHLKELAKEYEGEIYIYKVNTDVEKELAKAFNIKGIPALLFCSMEGKPQMLTGARTKANYDKLINDILLK